MPRWSMMVTDTTTRTLIARHVPMTGVSFSDGLMDTGGTFQGEFPIGHPAFSAWVSSDQLRRVIWPCRDGVPQGAYLFTEMPAVNADTATQPVRGQRLDWLLGRRAITKTLAFANVDQNRIIRDLMAFGMGRSTQYASPNARDDDAVLPAAQIPWIVLDGTLSGVTRTRQDSTGATDDGYPASARKLVGPAVKDICDLREGATRGPEYRWLYRLATDGLPEMVLDMAGPSFHVGKPEDAQPIVAFEFPGGRHGNVRSASYGSDGTTIVTRGHSIGKKQDTSNPVGSALYGGLHDIGYPLIDKVASESSVQDTGVLNAKAAGYLAGGDDAWAVTLDGSGNPAWGSYSLGDWVVLRVRQGATPRRRSMRITGWTIKVDSTGAAETITPTLQVGKWYS